MMQWNKEQKELGISFQDLEHILGWYEPEGGLDFDEALKSELFLAGLRDADGNGLDPKDIKRIIINYQARTIWAKGTPSRYLETHKGKIAE